MFLLYKGKYFIHMHDFKQFATEIWQNTNIKTTLLNYQDNHNITVCIILYAMWCDKHGYHFNSGCIDVVQRYERNTNTP